MAKQVNRKQVDKIAKIWNQRADKLKDYWKDKSKPIEKRRKAFKLCYEMNTRIVNLARISMGLDSVFMSKYEKGGI